MDNLQIRKKLLKKRWSLDAKEKRKMDHEIFLKVIEEIKKNNPTKNIACYWPIENEVDTTGIISELLKLKYKICLPAISDNEMVFKPIESLGFAFETWKSMRQPETKEQINRGEIEIMIVPIIGFNENNNRLGYGKNFYNNYLSKSLGIKTIGVAYGFQKTNEIIVTEKDIKLDKIITN